MYAQLESMMTAVKKEAGALESMKAKIKDLEEIKQKMPEVKRKLQEAEEMNDKLKYSLRESEVLAGQLRSDMQKLNDLYNVERKEHTEARTVKMQLEQDTMRMQQETIFLQNEVQKVQNLRKKNQGLNSQLKQSHKVIEEEKTLHTKAIATLEKKLDEAEKSKSENSHLFWTLTEDLKKSQAEVKLAQESKDALEEALKESKTNSSLIHDRALMLVEDQASTRGRQQDSDNLSSAENSSLKAEIESLRAFMISKEESHIALSQKVKNLEDLRTHEKAEVKSKMTELKDQISNMRNQNHELEKDAMDARHKLGLIGGDVSRFTIEIEHLQKELTKSETARIHQDADFNRELKAFQAKESSLTGQRDEALYKMQTATTQLVVLQNQVRENQSRNWEELQRAKDQEAQISEEMEALTAELQEKTMKLITIEAEHAKAEEMMHNEVTQSSQMALALRGELEKRLDELTSARRERDGLRNEKDQLLDKVQEMDIMMKRNEQTFKKTLETDRSKIQQEVRTKVSRLKVLEGEKQELLRETNELMLQVTENQKELSKLRQDAVESKRLVTDLTQQVDIAKSNVVDLTSELKVSAKKEQDLREQTAKIEGQFREDMSRLDQIVKESKKAAAQQVLEITLRAKAASEEIEELKQQKNEIYASEKKAYAEVEKVKIECEMIKKNHEAMQNEMGNDMTSIRREIQEHRTKSKIMTENKSKMEMELMTVRLEMTKQESEMSKMSEFVKEVEVKMHDNNEAMKKSKLDSEHAKAEEKRLGRKIVELEESMAKKSVALDKATKEIGKMEREGLAETRRLKVSLANAEQELAELRPVIPMLQKELADGKASFAKLQASTNSTVNGLLEELRNTENALSQERKVAQHATEKSHNKLLELQTNLQTMKEMVELTESRSSQTRNDTALKVIQAENEMERMKTLISSKEARVEELEKQHQSDRSRLHELKEQLDNAERSIIDAKTNLELEQTQRRRLENRLRTVSAELSRATMDNLNSQGGEDDSFRATSPIKFTSSNGGTPMAHRASLLYDDDSLNERENIYDDSVARSDLTAPVHTRNESSRLANKHLTMVPKPSIDDDDILSMTANPSMSASQSEPNLFESRVEQTTISPVDRVSAALAARAAAEASKNTLKQAQQQRNYDRQMQSQPSEEEGDEFKQYQVFRRSSKGKVNEVREIVAGATEKDSAGGNGDTVNSSIQRTQLFLQQRLAKVNSDSDDGKYAKVAANATALAQSAYSKQMGRPNHEVSFSAGSGQVPLDTILDDHSESSGDNGNSGHMTLQAPSLHPASPPKGKNAEMTLMNEDYNRLPKISQTKKSNKR